VADGVGALAGLRIAILGRRVAGPSIFLDVASGRGRGFRESTAAIGAGLRIGQALGPLRAWLGIDLAGGAVVQSIDGGESAATPVVSAGGFGGLAAAVGGSVSIGIEARVPAALLRRDGDAAVVVVPAAWLGLQVHL
jgi:hypothetical protein